MYNIIYRQANYLYITYIYIYMLYRYINIGGLIIKYIMLLAFKKKGLYIL